MRNMLAAWIVLCVVAYLGAFGEACTPDKISDCASKKILIKPDKSNLDVYCRSYKEVYTCLISNTKGCEDKPDIKSQLELYKNMPTECPQTTDGTNSADAGKSDGNNNSQGTQQPALVLLFSALVFLCLIANQMPNGV
ncbi:uncharacterized protein LOC131927132 [Physella acuta]|uniref:uncharacterized protein LOC131927132 n=1 Tax=Physella acuta TaxID=109671 RepID=UPI0027DDC418|nr:uncharacterized protein LOC131927132 [Physella acuta]